MKIRLHDFVFFCLLTMLCLGLIGNFMPIIPNVEASPSLFFIKSGDYYYIGNSNWNLTYVDDATYGWIWESIQHDVNGLWEPIYGSFYVGSSKRMVRLYKSLTFYNYEMTSANAVTNTSTLKCFAVSGLKTIGSAEYNITITTCINETNLFFKYDLTINTTVIFSKPEDTIRIDHFSPSSTSQWYVDTHNQTIWFPKGYIFRSKPNTKFYAEITNDTRIIGEQVGSNHEAGDKAWRGCTPSLYGERTSYTSYMFAYFQDNTNLFDFASTLNNILDGFGVSNVYEYEDVDASIKRHIDTEVMSSVSGLWRYFPTDSSSIGIWISTNQLFCLGGTSQDSAGIGDALLELYELTSNQSYLDRAKEVGNMIVNHAYNSTHKYFYEFINEKGHPQQNILLSSDEIMPYGQATMIEFLFNLYENTNNQTYLNRALNVTDFWVSKQNPDGSWNFRWDRIPLTPHWTTFWSKASGASYLAHTLLYAYELTSNSTYLNKANLGLNWIYTQRLQYGDGTYGAFAHSYYGYEESPLGTYLMMNTFADAYLKTSNTTYLTWAENLYKLTLLFRFRKDMATGEGHLGWMTQWAQKYQDYAVPRYYVVEALINLYQATSNLTYVDDAIKFQRAFREFIPHSQHYYHILKDNGYFENVADIRVSAHIVRSAVILKETIGDVYLGSTTQLALNEDTVFSGNADGLYAYTTVIKANITSATYSDEKLTITIYATSGVTSTTKIYVPAQGKPTNVSGADRWGYNSTTKIIKLTVAHAGEREIILDWTRTLPSTYVFNVTLQNITYRVSVLSNSTVEAFNFSQQLKEISFNGTSLPGSMGFCNVTIPLKLLNGNFTVLFNGTSSTYTLTQNATQSSLYFTYGAGAFKIQIIGTTVATPPVADFTVSKTNPYRGETIMFNATASYEPDGYIISYTWDFGDGNITKVYNTTDTTYWLINHTYNYTSEYQVSLTVTDNDGLYNTKKLPPLESINVEPVHDVSTVEASISSTMIIAGESVSINITVKNEGDTSESFNVTVLCNKTTTKTYTVENLASSAIDFTTFNWNTTGISGGTYTLKAEAKLSGETIAFLDDNLKIVGTIVIQEKPIADFSYTPANPVVEQAVTFNASASYDHDGHIASYTWDFGDGNITTITNPIIVHQYSTAGTHNVNLTMTDNDGLTTQKVIQVFIGKTTSITMLTLSTTTITLGENVTLSGQILQTRAGAAVTIMYKLLGDSEWDILTTVTDANGQYSYSWRPEEAGTYEVEASWEGDYNALPDKSDVQTLTVKIPLSSTPFYQIIGIIITVVALGLIYILVSKKLHLNT